MRPVAAIAEPMSAEELLERCHSIGAAANFDIIDACRMGRKATAGGWINERLWALSDTVDDYHTLCGIRDVGQAAYFQNAPSHGRHDYFADILARCLRFRGWGVAREASYITRDGRRGRADVLAVAADECEQSLAIEVKSRDTLRAIARATMQSTKSAAAREWLGDAAGLMRGRRWVTAAVHYGVINGDRDALARMTLAGNRCPLLLLHAGLGQVMRHEPNWLGGPDTLATIAGPSQ